LFAGLAAWWLWMPAGAAVIWLVKHLIFGGYGQQDQGYALSLQSELFPRGSLLDATPLFWVWAFVGFTGTLVIIATVTGGHRRRGVARALTVVTVAAMGLSLVLAWTGFWDNDKNAARYYTQATAFRTAGIDPAPSSLRALTNGARKASGAGGCDYAGTADVPSCIKITPAPDFSWDPRTASYEAASTIMSSSSALASQVDVMGATVHYLPGSTPGHGVWTAILDGSGTRPAEGVAVWNGQANAASICQFQGSDSFNRAFGGYGADSLRNLIAQKFPALVYVDHDISGYCDGTGAAARPVIVIPVERQIGWKDRTVLRPAGILVLTGSPDGRPAMSYHATVRAGEYPDQVYPESIAAAQLSATDWAAGRGNMDDGGFGYAKTSVDTNRANPGEYVLRSNADGHFYFVTPLTPRDSSSQAVVAYAVERADEVAGGLNPLVIYVQRDSANPVSMTILQSRMTTYINQVAPGLLTSGAGGQLQEIIPFGRDTWRGFVDISGVTQDFIDMSSDVTVTPVFAALHGRIAAQPPGAGGGPPPSGPPVSCAGALATMTTSQLAQCIQQFANALSQRAQSPAPAPAATPKR